MRTKWKKASARPRIGSNRALRQRPTNSLLQTSKPGRSLFVLGVFFFVLSFRLLLLLDLLGVFGFACLYRDLWCDWCTPSTWRSTSTWRSRGRRYPAPETFKKLGLVWGRWSGGERGRWVAEGWRRLAGWSRRRLAPWTIVAWKPNNRWLYRPPASMSGNHRSAEDTLLISIVLTW